MAGLYPKFDAIFSLVNSMKLIEEKYINNSESELHMSVKKQRELAYFQRILWENVKNLIETSKCTSSTTLDYKLVYFYYFYWF